MTVIKPETNTEEKVSTSDASPDGTPETSTDFSEELVNKISCLRLNDLNDEATLSEENSLEAQVNERGHDRNQPRERHDCPYTRNLSIGSSNFEILSSLTNEPASRQRLLLSGGGRIESPPFSPCNFAYDDFTYLPQIASEQNRQTPKPSNEEEAFYLQIREKIRENENMSPIPFDELSNLPDEVVDLALDNENQEEKVQAISPNSYMYVPEICNSGTGTQLGTTGIVYVQMVNHPVMIQNKKLPAISPKADPPILVQNNQIQLPRKKESQEDKYHKQFLKLNRDIGVGKRDDENRTFLHVLIQNEDQNFAIYLVTKIHNCIQRRQTTKLDGIQSVTSFINSCDNSGQTALYYAAIYNQPKITECLLSFGSDPNVAETHIGNSPLHAASERGKRYLDIVKHLCQCIKVDINSCNKKGKSALHLAVQSHDILHDHEEKLCEKIDSSPIIEHLLHKNANLTTQDKDGKTALHLAAERCKPDLIRILQANAKDWQEAVNMVDKKGSTALHIAASLLETEELQKDIIIHLLSRDAKSTIRDSLGRVPAELVPPERKSIADLLKSEWSQEYMQYVPI